MDMTLSKRGDYVMRSAISLARAELGAHRKIREVVADTELPQTFASQILADLVRAGLATSKAGRNGGYRLARAPSEISVLEVIEAAEGPLRAERCALGEGPCRWDAVCPLHETWSEATVTLRELLSTTTLAQVAERDAAIEAGTYAVPPDAHRSHLVAVDVADSVQVELAEAKVHAALARIAGTLAELVATAAEGATAAATEASLDRVDPLAPVTEQARYLLTWRLASPGPGSHLEADLLVVAVDAERCELRIEGTWRRGTEEALVVYEELEHQARRTVRAFLRNLARWLEEEPGTRSVSQVRAT